MGDEIKVGDKVRVVDATRAATTEAHRLFTSQEVLTVRRINNDGGATLAELEGGISPMFTWRLRKVVQSKAMTLPADPQVRKDTPITTGVLDYFPLAIAAVAQCSKAGNDQHNPGQPLHWAKEKSTGHADCIARHLIDRGTVDTDGIRHSAKLAWRALANLQIELEKEQNATAK